MTSHVTLLLFCMLFSKALSLTCHQCISSSGKKKPITCANQCLTATISVDQWGKKSSNADTKTCSTLAQMHVNGSMNLGEMKITVNAKCCKAIECITKTTSETKSEKNVMNNNKKCYTCKGHSCLETRISCKGNEDRCITASVKRGSETLLMKGCISNSLCTAAGYRTAIGATSLKCCQGNLCNGVERFTLSLILMIVPLLSSFLLY